MKNRSAESVTDSAVILLSLMVTRWTFRRVKVKWPEPIAAAFIKRLNTLIEKYRNPE